MSTTFTVGGSLTNFNAGTGTLSNGELLASTPGAAATIRFAGADIRTIQNGAVSLFGANARITDLLGNSAVRNLQRLENARFTSAGFETITPNGVIGGTFTSSNSTLTIESEATLRVRGNYYGTTNSTTSLRGAGTTSGTCLSVEGSALFDQGARFDFGGQPGVNTIYTTKLQVINGLEYRGAFLTGTGTIIADTLLTQGSRLSPGRSAGQLDFEGALTFAVGTSLALEIGGLTPGSEFDLVTQTGPLDLTLGGVLDLSFIGGFESLITSADTFEIITSENALLGEFDNIASGGRLDTSDGLGSFLVTYDGANSVVLSDFAPVPEPGAWALMGSALAVMLGRRRRSSRA